MVVQTRKSSECVLFSIVLRILQFTHNLGSTGPIQVGFSAKCASPNEHFNQIENKLKMFDFRLTSLDRITYYTATI